MKLMGFLDLPKVKKAIKLIKQEKEDFLLNNDFMLPQNAQNRKKLSI